MAFYETQRTKGTLLWMLSTKMLPPVGVLVPIYLLAKQFGLLDSRAVLIIIYTLINLPILVWMIYTYFKDIPRDIGSAARSRGGSKRAGSARPFGAGRRAHRRAAARASGRGRAGRPACRSPRDRARSRRRSAREGRCGGSAPPRPSRGFRARGSRSRARPAALQIGRAHV